MKLAVHVHVHIDGDAATAAGVAFDEWGAFEPSTPSSAWTTRISPIEKAPRGAPDLRAVPYVLQLLREKALAPELILVDGFVHLDAQETPGWGWHLHHALGGSVPVIGLSTASRPGLSAQFEVMREEEARPVLVTCIGIDLGAAKARLRGMHGRKRVPTLMKLAKRLAKGADD